MSSLAINGGSPTRETLLPYGRQDITPEDVAAVTSALTSDYLTTGPEVAAFEQEFASVAGARYAVSANSGTAALHAAMVAAGIGPGDEVITTPLTFCATSNAALYVGATPVFADIHPDALSLDPAAAEAAITPRTKAIACVDFAGHPADLDAFRQLADTHHLILIEDACHALGATYHQRPVGSIADFTCFSFHPVKHITTGEGGMVTTNNAEWYEALLRFRNHGIVRDASTQAEQGEWFYEMTDLGYNYRLPDINCALGRSQLKRLSHFIQRRSAIACEYHGALAALPQFTLPFTEDSVQSAWHLYPIRLNLEQLTVDRKQIFRALRAENIGVQVHYIPVHLQPYYRQAQQGAPGQYPIAEDAYNRLISLPIFPAMTEQDLRDVVAALTKVLTAYSA